MQDAPSQAKVLLYAPAVTTALTNGFLVMLEVGLALAFPN